MRIRCGRLRVLQRAAARLQELLGRYVDVPRTVWGGEYATCAKSSTGMVVSKTSMDVAMASVLAAARGRARRAPARRRPTPQPHLSCGVLLQYAPRSASGLGTLVYTTDNTLYLYTAVAV